MEEDLQYLGFYKGEISDNKDPENLGRLRLKVPDLYGDEAFDYWALPLGLFAGKSIGFFAIPSKGDHVWVTFENGDPRFPLWTYGWWSQGQRPETASTDVSVIQTNAGHRIEFDDREKLLRVSDANGNIILMNNEGISIISDNISLGKENKSAEPAVVGDTLERLLKEMMADLGNLKTIKTSNGVTASLNTATNWSTFKGKWDGKWEEFKSKVVNLEKE